MSAENPRPHRVELGEAELDLVRRLLRRARKDMFWELHKTDDRELRQALKGECDALEAVLGRLGSDEPAVGPLPEEIAPAS